MSARRLLSSSSAPMSFIEKASRHGAQSLLGAFHVNAGRFDDAFTSLHVDEITPTGALCTVEVTERLGNSYGSLHGGAIASLVDIAGTLALLGVDKDKGGVTVELSTSFIAAAPVGSTVKVKAACLKMGRTLGFTQVDLYNDKGALIATGRHTKAFAASKKP